MLYNIEAITMSYVPEVDITGIIFILIIIYTIMVFASVAAMEILHKKVMEKINYIKSYIKQIIGKRKYNKFYNEIVANKILLSANELEEIQNKYLNC